MREMFQVEKRDQNLTPAAQIERLTKPGHTYRNLNPFEVLQVDPDTSIDEAKKKFRRMSILVHPDKNQSCAEKAQTAFDAVKRAWNLLGKDEVSKYFFIFYFALIYRRQRDPEGVSGGGGGGQGQDQN